MSMRLKKLGNSGIEVSPMGLGCWAIGGLFRLFGEPDGWGEVDDAESVRAVRRAVELGVTLFDTADAYGTGHSEEVLGEALEGVRESVVIATKGGYVHDREKREVYGEDTSPAYIRGALEASLKRLGTDYVDVYQVHNGDVPEENIGPLFHELDKLKAEGKIRAYGWSTYGAANVGTFASKTKGAVIQTKANIFTYDGAAHTACERNGLACLCNTPLGMGFLSGKFTADTRFGPDDVRSSAFGWTEYFKNGKPKPEFLRRMSAIREVLQSGGRTAAQGALGWLWAKSFVNIPIPGFKTLKQAEENARAMAFGPLDNAQMAQIETLLPPRAML
jgi:aryl-alcohol dehydrogenase-like predicted oxidoreductase